MPNVIFKFDKEKDLFNIWETCNKENRWFDFKKNINPKIVKLCQNKNFEEVKKELETHYEKLHNSELMKFTVKTFNLAWKSINDEYFKRLEKIMRQPICSKKIIGYLTLAGRCPYDFNIKNSSFMINFFNTIPKVLQTTGHEIMHIQFHNTYWEKIEKKIGKEKTADLKEALTVLLNLEFKDLWFVDDTGYESHQELRKFIEKEWKKEKDFEVLLEKCVNYLEKNGTPIKT